MFGGVHSRAKKNFKRSIIMGSMAPGIINYMGKKEFQDAWATIKNNKCYPEDFRIYMDNLREDAKK